MLKPCCCGARNDEKVARGKGKGKERGRERERKRERQQNWERE